MGAEMAMPIGRRGGLIGRATPRVVLQKPQPTSSTRAGIAPAERPPTTRRSNSAGLFGSPASRAMGCGKLPTFRRRATWVSPTFRGYLNAAWGSRGGRRKKIPKSRG